MHDRMPVILSDADLDTWLDPATDPAQFGPLMVPCPDDWLTVLDAGPVSRAKAPALF
jgi:putative SOS response-associated peptidase YedK